MKLRFKLLALHDYSGHEVANTFFFVFISLKNVLFTRRPKRLSDLGQTYNLNFSRQYKNKSLGRTAESLLKILYCVVV